MVWLHVPWCSLFSVLVIVHFTIGEQTVYTEDDEGTNLKHGSRTFNFAAQSSGAAVLDKSPESGKGFRNLLNDDKDKYAISPCKEKKWVVVGLSEEIAVTTVILANYEKYSSTVREFQLLSAKQYPTSEWIDLGTYTAEPKLGEQVFNITRESASSYTTRYLKVKFLTHYNDEALCTLSQIKVYGMTLMEWVQANEDFQETPNVKVLLNDDNTSKPETNKNVGDNTLPSKSLNNSTNTVVVSDESAQVKTDSFEEPSEPILSALEKSDNKEGAPEEKVDDELIHADESSNVKDELDMQFSVNQDGGLTITTSTTIAVEDNNDHQSNYNSLTALANQSTSQDDKKVTIAGLELNIGDWKKVYTIFNESHASMELLLDTLRRIQEFFDPSEETFSMNRLEGHLSSESSNLSTLEVRSEGLVVENVEDQLNSKDAITGAWLSPPEQNSVDDVPIDDSSGEVQIENEANVAYAPSIPQVSEFVNLDSSCIQDSSNSESAKDEMVEDKSGAAKSEEMKPSYVEIVHKDSSIDDIPADLTMESKEPPSLDAFETQVSQQLPPNEILPVHSQHHSYGELIIKAGEHFNCFEDLEFDIFQEKMKLKLQSLKDDNNSGASSMSHHTDNVFKVLIQRIKSLELNQAILEMYIEQMTHCFQAVSKESVNQWQKTIELSNRIVALEETMLQRLTTLEAEKPSASIPEVIPENQPSSTLGNDMHLLKFVKQPDFHDGEVNLDDIFHRIIYYFLHWMKDVKMKIVPTVKETDWFNKFFHRSKHFKENRDHFIATHSAWEIYREYVIEIILVVVAIGVGLTIMSSLLLGFFFAFMWLLYHCKSKGNMTENR